MRRSTARALGLVSLAGAALSAILTPLVLPAGGFTYYGSVLQLGIGIGLLAVGCGRGE